MINLDELLKAASELRPISSSLSRLLSEACSPDADVEEIVKIVESDIALLAVVLRQANSAANFRGGEVSDVKTAVVRLGFGTLACLATGQAFRKDMVVAIPEYGLHEEELWRHSLACAVAAEGLQTFCSKRIPNEAYAAALLHDIGKVLLRTFITQEMVTGFDAFLEENPGACFLEAEASVLGITHAELGAKIARDWQLPEGIVEGIEWHHAPDERESPVSDVIHIANLVAKTIGEGLGREGLGLTMSQDAPHRLGFDADSFEPLCAMTLQRYHATLEAYSPTVAT